MKSIEPMDHSQDRTPPNALPDSLPTTADFQRASAQLQLIESCTQGCWDHNQNHWPRCPPGRSTEMDRRRSDPFAGTGRGILPSARRGGFGILAPSG